MIRYTFNLPVTIFVDLVTIKYMACYGIKHDMKVVSVKNNQKLNSGKFYLIIYKKKEQTGRK